MGVPKWDVPRCLGLSVAALSSLVMVAWFAGWDLIVQGGNSAWVPMQFNTALCAALVGSGLFIGGKTLKVSSLAAGIIGAATMTQYLSGYDLMIDELVITHEIVVETSHPGRMAPKAALALCLTSVACLIPMKTPRQAVTKLCLAVVVAMGSVIALVGYALNVTEMYRWADLTSMAVHTAILFGLLSASLCIRAWRRLG